MYLVYMYVLMIG